MTQIGEPVDFAMVYEEEVKCPFDHDTPEPPTVNNDLIGVGTTLASRMKAQRSIYLYDAVAPGKPAKILNPRDVSGHPFYKQNRCVKVVFPPKTPDGEETECLYPVTCAAHHCIPAQESLKESPLLAYMCKKGDSEPIKGGSFSDGLVWSDVGLDINGSENGIYLPGSYAVGGGRGGLSVWYPQDTADEEEPEIPEDKKPAKGYEILSGRRGEISKTNALWAYVSQAVRKCPGQFHDRHEPYSLEVQGWLQKIFENYENLNTEMIDNGNCPDCKKRADKIAEHGIPTPYQLVARLMTIMDKLKGYLNATTWRINIYTSKWGKAYMEAVKAKNPDADHLFN
ncbi:MAG: hypothetical protein Kow0074_24190 [Candidatus Zixiibacteriota bacterium]